MANEGCLIWIVLFGVLLHGCNTAYKVEELKQEVKELRSRPKIIQVQSEVKNDSN